MLERIAGDIVFECDSCPESLETETDDFQEAKAELQRAGWKTYNQGGEWCHSCPACLEDFKAKQRDKRSAGEDFD